MAQRLQTSASPLRYLLQPSYLRDLSAVEVVSDVVGD